MPHGTAAQAEVAYVALGSNLGDRRQYLAAGRRALAALPDTALIAASDLEETAPLGPQDQPPYLNQMVALRTTLQPSELLDRLHAIEGANGRVRTVRWGARTLDLDIVEFGERHLATHDLTIPHPELPRRPFWIRELEQLRSQLAAASTGAHI
jgi:2-amino-4-hydroxy-6-hydroxymethyldihydropteridine diphosphokinase